MGKIESKLSNGQTLDTIKSVKKSIGGHQKNLPINPIYRSDRDERSEATSIVKGTRLVELTLVVWLDASSGKATDATQKTLNHLRRITHIVETFTDIEKCYEYMDSINEGKIFFVVSGSFGPQIVPRIDDFDQIYSIYIYCGNKANHLEWTKPYKKIKGIHTQLKDLSESLRNDNTQYDKGITSISLLPATTNIDLDESNKQFIYLQIMKSILLEIQYDKKFRQELLTFARPFYVKHEQQLGIIDKFEENYNLHSPIWWYTRRCFLYRMLRKAFYEQDFELIYKLAFFIRDLHRDIKKNYLQAHNHQYHSISIFRTSRMSIKEFEDIEKNIDGLLSFNDFVLTTLERSIAYKFATKLRHDSDGIIVIYRIDIDPTKSSIPFIALHNLTYLANEGNGEILLSMNTIFHIDAINKQSDRFYEITLTPANKKDEQIINLVDFMQELTNGLSGWFRLSKILMDVKEYDQVENIYKYMFSQTKDDDREQRAFLLHEIGYINDLKNNLSNSISNYQQAISIYLHYLPANHSVLSTTYTNLAAVLQRHGDLNEALVQYQNALKCDKTDDLDVVVHYNNIASVLQQQGKYSDAQHTYEKAIQKLLKDFPSAYPIIAETYHNIAGMFYSTRDYSKALDYYTKTLEIEEQSLPKNHPSLISTCFNLATTYEALGDTKRAIKYAEKSVEKARIVYGNDHAEVQENLNYVQQLKQKNQAVLL